MSNMIEDILKAVHDKAENKVAGIMVKINLVLEKPDMYAIETVEGLISQLTVAQTELTQAKSLYSQALTHSSQKAAELQKRIDELNALKQQLPSNEVSPQIETNFSDEEEE